MKSPTISTRIALALVACSALLPSVTQAASYDEATQGDLAGNYLDPSLPTIMLDAGKNTLAGTVTYVYDEDVPLSDGDAFRLFVPTGLEIYRVSLSQTLADGLGTLTSVGWGVWDLGASGSDRPTLPISFVQTATPGQTRNDFKQVMPLEAGYYAIATSSFTGAVSSTLPSKSADYVFTVYTQVATAVPEPSSLALLSGGLLVCAGWKRRRARA